jgi:hypothetical protein
MLRVTLEASFSKKGINEGRNGTALRKDNQGSEHKKHNDNGEKPIPLPEFQKLPEFTDDGLIRHVSSLHFR